MQVAKLVLLLSFGLNCHGLWISNSQDSNVQRYQKKVQDIESHRYQHAVSQGVHAAAVKAKASHLNTHHSKRGPDGGMWAQDDVQSRRAKSHKLFEAEQIAENAKNHKYVKAQKVEKFAYVTMWLSHKQVPHSIKRNFKTLTMDTAEQKKELIQLAKEKSMEVFVLEKVENGTEITEAKETIPLLQDPKARNLKVDANLADGVSLDLQFEKNTQKKYWADGEGKRRVLAMATKLKRSRSKYPIVVLTNDPVLLKVPAHNEYNLIIKNIADDESWVHHSCKTQKFNLLQMQKLSVFGMTEYDKVMWLDLDMDISRNMDSVFDNFHIDNTGNQIWGQQDNYVSCAREHKLLCTGMMLLKPKKEIFDGLKETANTMERCWGDQQVISKFFQKSDSGRDTNLFPQHIVDFSHCPASRASYARHTANDDSSH